MSSFNAIENFRLMLKRRKSSVGGWLQMECVQSAIIMSKGNFDWIVVDLEHGHFSNSCLPIFASLIKTEGRLPFARLADSSERGIRTCLDAGFDGILVPNVSSVDELRSIVRSCLPPPRGVRGIGFCSANGFGFEPVGVWAREIQPIIIPMIESVEGVEMLNELASLRDRHQRLEDIDGLFIGPYDLSASLGCVGDFSSSAFTETLSEIFRIADELSLPLGLHVTEPDKEMLNSVKRDGYQIIGYGTDAAILRSFSQSTF